MQFKTEIFKNPLVLGHNKRPSQIQPPLLRRPIDISQTIVFRTPPSRIDSPIITLRQPHGFRRPEPPSKPVFSQPLESQPQLNQEAIPDCWPVPVKVGMPCSRRIRSV